MSLQQNYRFNQLMMFISVPRTNQYCAVILISYSMKPTGTGVNMSLLTALYYVILCV